ncbi:uncharacterized protein LOC101965466 isoform X3 [Ictidomys tridecemlineatus]
MPRDGGPCPSASQQGDESLTQVLQEVPLYTWWPGGEMAAFSLQGANAWPRIGSKAGAHCPQWAVSQRVPEAALSCPSMATLLADLGESVFQHPWPSRICLEEIKINAILYNSTLVPSDPYTRDLFNYLTAATKPEVLCPPQPPPPRDWIAEADERTLRSQWLVQVLLGHGTQGSNPDRLPPNRVAGEIPHFCDASWCIDWLRWPWDNRTVVRIKQDNVC